MRNFNWRLFFILALTAAALYVSAPTLIYFSLPKEVRTDETQWAEALPDYLPSSYVKLGLDLQGGVQLVLSVDTEDAVRNKLSQLGTEVSRYSKDENLGVETAYVKRDEKVLVIETKPGTDLEKLRQELKSRFVGLEQIRKSDNILEYAYSNDYLGKIKDSSLEQAEKVVRSRVDKWGVSEPLIARRHDGSILVQLPGFRDPEKAKDLLGRTAQLKFKLVADDFTGFSGVIDPLPEGISRDSDYSGSTFVGSDREQMKSFLGPKLEDGLELAFERVDAAANKSEYRTFVLKAATQLSGEDVVEASVSQSSDPMDNRPAVSLELTGPGGKRFEEVTGENIGKQLAIVLDDVVVSAPNIQNKISGGRASITMGSSNDYNETLGEAQELSLILRSGALPAKIKILEERQVGATLGPELAKRGIQAALLGIVLVFVFMLAYYRRPGLIACVAIGLNALFLLAGMTIFNFALTLPGIAGFILTLGMAVDANVLINERIKQEIASGKNARTAVTSGIDKVFWTIVDANITTLIAAIVLLETNTSGPIRGFAVTLILGLLVSLFTSLFCTRAFFNLALKGSKTDRGIRKWLGAGKVAGIRAFNFNFLKIRKIVAGIAIATVVFVSVFVGMKGMNWAVDFAGGTELEVDFSDTVSVKKLRSLAKESGINSLIIQNVGAKEDHRYIMRFESKDPDSVQEILGNLKTKMSTEMASLNPDVQRVDFVGPQIGKELQKQGVLSVLFAMLGIFIYVLLRFDIRFAPGVIAKMLFDVIVIMAMFSVLRLSFDLTSVAAILTVVGYSVNDAIVIYDRIRENLILFPRRKLFETINFSLNETLTRTINTSATTVLALIGILIFGSGQIWNFALAMVVGVVSATLSSMFLASAFVLWIQAFRNRKSANKVAT